jgi:hypothetical protein
VRSAAAGSGVSALGERLLVLAPTGRDAALSCEILREEGFRADACESIALLCAAVGDDAGALLIGEEALTPASTQLLVDTLDHQPPWSDIPVIVLAGREFSDSATRRPCWGRCATSSSWSGRCAA